MIVLGIYPSYILSNHDAGVAIAKDGELIYAFEEEKLSRVNHRESKYLPDRALLSALYTTNIDPREIDLICLAGANDGVTDPHGVFRTLERYFGISCKEVVPCRHHVAHSALSVLGSGFESCVYWTVDADGGDGTTGEFGVYDGGSFSQLCRFERPSLARFYWLLTGVCGFSDFEEGKVMGLASYGDVDKSLYGKMTTLFEFDPSGYAVFTGETVFKPPKLRWDNFSHDEFRAYKVIQYLDKGLCPALEEMSREYLPEIVAATGQKLTQDLATESLGRLLSKNGLEPGPLALSGGFFQNVITNKEIQKAFNCEIFIPPAVSDMGQAAGGALWACHKYDSDTSNKGTRGSSQVSPFLGPDFSEKEVEDLLNSFPIEYSTARDGQIADIAATQIAEGKVVGWFQGKGEFGARALGARSVLADPRNPNSKARVNQLLKKRDWFMPYAPSILEEYAHEVLVDYTASPYMTMAFDAAPQYRDKIPAAIHVDGTVRPHCVRAADEPLFHRLISEFMRITGIPVVLNTSFNRHGVPIVATPRQAIEHLLEGVVDILCIGPFAAVRKGDKPASDGQLIPESIFRALYGVRKGYGFLAEGDSRAAEAIFQQTGYKVEYSYTNGEGHLRLNGHEFHMYSARWDEIAASLAKEGILPNTPDRLGQRT